MNSVNAYGTTTRHRETFKNAAKALPRIRFTEETRRSGLLVPAPATNLHFDRAKAGDKACQNLVLPLQPRHGFAHVQEQSNRFIHLF